MSITGHDLDLDRYQRFPYVQEDVEGDEPVKLVVVGFDRYYYYYYGLHATHIVRF